jgi:DNA-binding NtrC family response regulator/predicted ATPase
MEPLAELLGESPKIVALRDQVRQLLRAWTPSRRPPPILIQGETGTGKGLLARALHRASPRSAQPFVDLNCAAVPETLLEAELFGYERGAFTDARQSKPGLFQLAHRGTLFLDEIGLLTPAMQAKLLSVIEDRSARRLGAVRAEPVDVWVVAATNEDLDQAIRTGEFREDLYHRLAVLSVNLPPLREREGDVFLLAERFLARVCADYGLPPKSLGPDARAAIGAYAWPGNVRELDNVMERAALLSDATELGAAHLGLPAADPLREGAAPAAVEPAELQSSRDLMRQHLLTVLTQTGWNISRSAALLGLSRNTVNARITRYGLRPLQGGRAAEPAAGSAAPELWPRTPVPTGRWEARRLLFLLIRIVAADAEHLSVRQALEAMTEKVRSFGGRVEGQGPVALLAVFGLGGTDDPAVCAAHTALVIRNAMKQSADLPSVRLGLHSAETLVQVAAGPPILDAESSRRAWNELDAAMEGAAPGVVVASAAMGELLRRRFSLTPLASGSTAYRIDGVWHARIGVSRPLGPFVGRTEELALLQSRLVAAAAGHGQVVSLAGDPGIGKSRLLVELAVNPRVEGAHYFEGRCLPAERQTPFFPLLQLVRDVCGIVEPASAGLIHDKITATLAELGLDVEELAPDLTHLLDPNTSPPAAPSPAVLKRRFFTAIQRLLVGRSARSPLVVAVEDLHWVDPSSEACLVSIVESIAGAPILLVTTHRPGYRPPWAGVSHALGLTLPPLSSADSLLVIRGVLETGTRSPELEHSIQARAEGNPLFLEELSRATGEPQEGSAPPVIPATIEDTIAARLNRLTPRQLRLLRVAAVIGRDFPLSLLRAIGDLKDEALEASVAHLQRADFLYQSGPRAVEPTYTFKHALVHEAAYARVSGPERRTLHGLALNAIERLYPDRLAEHVEQLAHHAVLGDERPRAVRYLFQAGQKAAGRSALAEALRHLNDAVGLLRTMPDDEARDRQEIEIELLRAGALRATKGFAAPEVGESCARAMDLCHRVGDQARLLPTLNGVYSFHLMRAEYARAGAAADELLALAQRQGNSTFEMIGHRAVGAVRYHTGRFAEARVALDRALALYDPAVHGALASAYGTDHAQVTSCLLGLTQWVLGRPAEAHARFDWALAHSERLAHPHSVALALSYLGILLIMAREHAAVPGPARRLVELSTRNSLTLLALSGRFYLAAARHPRTPAGVKEMEEAAEAWWETQATGYRPFVEQVIAEAKAEIGDVAGGLQLIVAAAGHLEESNERWVEAELHRVHGRLLAADPQRRHEAEPRLRRAMQVARAQDARMWELRAAVDLAALLREQGDRTRAREVLEPLLARFPAELETPDLAAGRALRASLD